MNEKTNQERLRLYLIRHGEVEGAADGKLLPSDAVWETPVCISRDVGEVLIGFAGANLLCSKFFGTLLFLLRALPRG